MSELQINILRGENKIGENLIEITDGNTKLLLECGVALQETEQTRRIEEQVLRFCYDGVIITHCHADHCGLLKEQIHAEKIYIGEATYKILEYCGAVHEKNKEKICFMRNEKIFFIGNLQVTPYLCDHSAYDSYMLEIKAAQENLLYTGDFRANGRKNFEVLLKKLPHHVTYLITERTNVNLHNDTESDLEEKAVEIMKNHQRIFVLQSTLNIDRMVSFYRAAKRTGKPFIMSKSAADIGNLYENIPSPVQFSNCYTYLHRKQTKELHESIKSTYGNKLLARSAIAKKKGFVMQIHSGMLQYLHKLSQETDLSDSIVVYSMWKGYKTSMQAFLKGIEDLGMKIVDLHVSGHADLKTVKRLINKTHPKEIYMVHCEK